MFQNWHEQNNKETANLLADNEQGMINERVPVEMEKGLARGAIEVSSERWCC
jgi:hypothetical protein